MSRFIELHFQFAQNQSLPQKATELLKQPPLEGKVVNLYRSMCLPVVLVRPSATYYARGLGTVLRRVVDPSSRLWSATVRNPRVEFQIGRELEKKRRTY